MDDNLFNELVESVKDAGQYMRGKKTPSRVFEYPDPEPRDVREKTGLSQDKFALLLGVKPSTLRNWEQGRRKPTGPAKALLRLVNFDPEYALRALHPESKEVM